MSLSLSAKSYSACEIFSSNAFLLSLYDFFPSSNFVHPSSRVFLELSSFALASFILVSYSSLLFWYSIKPSFNKTSASASFFSLSLIFLSALSRSFSASLISLFASFLILFRTSSGLFLILTSSWSLFSSTFFL